MARKVTKSKDPLYRIRLIHKTTALRSYKHRWALRNSQPLPFHWNYSTWNFAFSTAYAEKARQLKGIYCNQRFQNILYLSSFFPPLPPGFLPVDPWKQLEILRSLYPRKVFTRRNFCRYFRLSYDFVSDYHKKPHLFTRYIAACIQVLYFMPDIPPMPCTKKQIRQRILQRYGSYSEFLNRNSHWIPGPYVLGRLQGKKDPHIPIATPQSYLFFHRLLLVLNPRWADQFPLRPWYLLDQTFDPVHHYYFFTFANANSINPFLKGTSH